MFTVIELQTNNGTTTAQAFHFDNENQAYQKYHEILMYAAVSTVQVHAATILNEYGNVLKNEFYTHEQEPEPNT